MTNTNQTAFPDTLGAGGMTKLEYLSAVALQGIIANKRYHQYPIDKLTDKAVEVARELIKSLNKPLPDEQEESERKTDIQTGANDA